MRQMLGRRRERVAITLTLIDPCSARGTRFLSRFTELTAAKRPRLTLISPLLFLVHSPPFLSLYYLDLIIYYQYS